MNRGDMNNLPYFDEEEQVDNDLLRQAMATKTNGHSIPVTEVTPNESDDKEEAPPLIDETAEKPLNQYNQKQLSDMMAQMRQMMGFLENQWKMSKDEFKITEDHMKSLYDFNEQHRVPAPEGEENAEGYDQFNGLQDLTDEIIEEIFGKDHPIIGVQLSQTLDRINTVVKDYFGWVSSIREYKHVHDAYISLIEFQEEKEIEALKKYAEEEEDPEKKKKMQDSVDLYYNRKYLDFIAQPIDPTNMERILKAFVDEKKVAYWIERTRRKLEQMKISSKFILEISQFEKRFLDEKYHNQNNILLLYFMSLIMYTDVYDKKNDTRTKAVCMVFGLDRIVRNTWEPDIKDKLMANIIAFEDQFLGKVPLKKTDNI